MQGYPPSRLSFHESYEVKYQCYRLRQKVPYMYNDRKSVWIHYYFSILLGIIGVSSLDVTEYYFHLLHR